VTKFAELTIGLFPGQGAYRHGGLRDAWRAGDPSVRGVFDAVDSAAAELLGTNVTGRIFTDDAPTLETLVTQAPDVLQLAIFGISVSIHEMLRRRGVRLSILMGHSIGEIAALVSSGAFSIRDGAAILCHRIAALAERDASGGGMAALQCTRSEAEQILTLLGHADVVIAVENGPSQTVISGPRGGLDRALSIANAIDVRTSSLHSPHPFHNPILAAAQTEFHERIKSYPQQKLHCPVYSPILGRFYRDSDPISTMLVTHLVTPVRFGSAIDSLFSAGARIFVEVGAGTALTGLVHAMYPVATTLQPLASSGGRHAVEQVAGFLTAGPSASGTAPNEPVTAVTRLEPLKEPPPPQDVPAANASVPPQRNSVEQDRDTVLAAVRKLYAEALEYPVEVLTEDALLEADLGVDSVRQTELYARLREQFDLGPAVTGFDAADYDTIGKIADQITAKVNALGGANA
jgi:acyl transferase domain-containing protein